MKMRPFSDSEGAQSAGEGEASTSADGERDHHSGTSEPEKPETADD
ncbi:hypothetical protein [Streptomyces alkaliterrae]|uniref:Uncharacterized protein n=1 Tax=Streptomyces alkaliterrae TaxID=2213162 RepID=A0A7W3WLM0_9ACTN|nr:hypothetical protein [Streptomyces alkaliterrae]MBB1254572.1 hypothetical protein [Streptomyces alkaliterrae]MBB1259434.1 hypothetical protein [Streptomyces alkaliterrae]